MNERSTPDATSVLRQYLADKSKLAPRIREALEQVLDAVEEAERVMQPLFEATNTGMPDSYPVGITVGQCRAAAEWKRKHGRQA